MSANPIATPNLSIYSPGSLPSLNSPRSSSSTDLTISGIERIQVIQSHCFQLSEILPDHYSALRQEVKKWKKIVENEKKTDENFYYQNDRILEDSIFINEMARSETKYSPSGTIVWSCTREGKLSGILLFQEKQTFLKKRNWIQVNYLLSHPHNIICRLRKTESPHKGAGEFLIEQLKFRALESPNCDGICLVPTVSSKEFYRKRGFQEEVSDKPIKKMFWNRFTK